MQRIALVLKRSENQALVLGRTISQFITAGGREVLLEASCEDLASDWNAHATDQIAEEADLMVVLGGDGTMLRAASLLNTKAVPVLGVNLGRVGYMAEVSPDEALQELGTVLDGRAALVERMMLQVTLPEGKTRRVLNEAVIHWGIIARLIEVGVRIGGAREIEVRADGLIVSTPIGSSAYSYAAHGPLVHPEIQAVIMTPICPYSGLMRPLLVPADRRIELVLKRGESLTLTLDGHTTVPLVAGQSVQVERSPFPFIMVRSKARDYVDIVKQKLGLL